MPQGLQVFDRQGNLTFDASTKTTRIYGSFNSGTTNGSITVDVPSGRKLWATINYIVTDCSNFVIKDWAEYDVSQMPVIIINGNVLSWEFNTPSKYSELDNMLHATYRKLNVNIIYGVY